MQKATPVASYMKSTMYGAHGTGKTLTSLLFAEGLAAHRGGRIAVIDTEHSEKFYCRAIPEREVHPDAFDYDVEHTRSMAKAIETVEALDFAVHRVIIIDSISHLWEAAREAWEDRNGGGDIPLRAWSSIKRPYKKLMRMLMEAPADVFICGREKNIFDDVDGKLQRLGVGMRAEGETQYEPDFNFHMTLGGKRGEVTVPTMFVEKDRSGILEGRTYPAPNFATIHPLLAYLGDEVIPVEDEEERLAADADAMDDKEKRAKKEQKSKTLLSDIQVQIQAATSVEALSAIGVEIKKKKRYMNEEDLDALRVFYESRRDRMVKDSVVEV